MNFIENTLLCVNCQTSAEFLKQFFIHQTFNLEWNCVRQASSEFLEKFCQRKMLLGLQF